MFCIEMVLVFFALISITQSVQARLGENEVACATRYNHGKDVQSTATDHMYPLLTGINTTNRTYSYKGWRIRIGFKMGIAHRIQYQHEKPPLQITDEELSAILNANGGLGAWTMDSQDGPFYFGKAWTRKDGAKAWLPIGSNSLTLDSAAYIRWQESSNKKKAKKPIPDF